jgi:nicotinate phosphoribosyltransferase
MMRDLNLLMDFYELTMANGYFVNGKETTEAVFDVFFRSVPDDGGYAIFAGLEQVIDYLEKLSFNEEEIKYLKSKKIFDDRFLNYLKEFTFTCDVFAMKEGTPIFPNEPIMVIKGPIIECQLIETMVLLTINHQSLIATKASRIVHAAQGRAVLEFGARRAHGYDASIFGARAAYIAGAVGTSNTYADYMYQIPALGTMAHAFVQSYNHEYDAFKAYAMTYPDQCVLLVDTYHTLKSGVPNAIKIHQEVLAPMGKSLKGIRLDSGDLAYLSKQARKKLDDAGLSHVTITVSNSLDEFLIRDLISQGAKIDAFGVGERLVTAKSESVFGGVFKLVAIEENGQLEPKIKLSDNPAKTTLPGFKQVYRFFQDGVAKADVITLFEETIDPHTPYLLFDPIYPFKKQWIENYEVKPLLVPIYQKGKLVYLLPSVHEIKAYKKEALECIYTEVRRLENPHGYYVDYSKDLYDLKQSLIERYQK